MAAGAAKTNQNDNILSLKFPSYSAKTGSFMAGLSAFLQLFYKKRIPGKGEELYTLFIDLDGKKGYDTWKNQISMLNKTR